MEQVEKVEKTETEKMDDVAKKVEKADKPQKTKQGKAWLVMLIIGIVAGIGGAVMFALPFVIPKEALPDLTFPKIPSATTETKYYSNLTGLEVASEAEKTKPAFCVQTPNGTDGARPQVGLTTAGVIFEAIAEAGITRFAAIYQNPESAVIGPIRSLRLYYLQWDTPFDCTIVHAGGADDAIEAVRSGGYKDLSESYAYMYRSYGGARLWNNLFTTGSYLMQFNEDYGYGGSEVKGFSRMTPDENERARIDATVSEKLAITEPAKTSTATVAPKVTSVAVNFGGWASFNVRYSYDMGTNSYLRSYESGAAHEVYVCPNENLGEVVPENSCYLSQMSPAVVAVMFVEEHKAEDNYHEDIAAVGSGEAYVFQNGISIHGRWEKPSVGDQIRFYDDKGAEISLSPGQAFVEAVPTYGNISFE